MGIEKVGKAGWWDGRDRRSLVVEARDQDNGFESELVGLHSRARSLR